ncbi:MAG: lysylphosphatidylglycerol synthase domain-containing protein, partial [Paracoccaceae bacterium]
LGADLSLPDAAAIFIFATLAGGLTGAPGGIGGAEAAMVGLLILEEVAPEISLAATAIIRLTTLWFAIALGLLIFTLAERHSKKVRDALVKN